MVRTCAHCSAPLRAYPSARVIECEYCGRANVVEATGPPLGAPPHVRRSAPVGVPQLPKRAVLVVAVGGGLSSLLIVVLVIASSVMSSSGSSSGSSSSRARSTSGGYPVSKLATYDDTAPIRIDAPPPPGGLSDFEPVANLPWALELARVWSSDAVLTEIRLRGVPPDGAMDVSGTRGSRLSVQYGFGSPSKAAEARAAAEVTRSIPPSRLEIVVRRGRVGAHQTAVTESVSPAAEPSPTCALPRLMSRWRDQGLRRRPTYSVHLDEWGWHVSYSDLDIDPASCEPRE